MAPSLSKDIRLDKNHNYEKYLNRHIFTGFHFEFVDNNDVKKTIMSLRSKTSTGHDGISTKLLKFISPALIESFRIIINQSLITGIYPHKLKIAKVIPIYKKELFILKLPDIVSLNALKIYYKYQKNALPVYFTTFDIQPQSSIHDHYTRQSKSDIRTHRTRIKLTEKCLRNYLPTIINLTPAYILSRVNTHPIQGFSSAIKSHQLNAYEAECAIQNCYVCQRQR